MRKFAIAFLRNLNPSLHSHACLKRGPPHFLSFNTLASTPNAAEVGASKLHALPDISMGALETRKVNVRKERELKADKHGCGSVHAEIPISIAEDKAKARPTCPKAKRKAKAKATELSHVGGLKAEDVIVHEEEAAAATQNAASGKAGEAALLAKEKAVQNAAIENASEEVANESIINAKKEFAEWVAKLDLSTFKRGRQWEEAAYKLLDHGISSAHVKKMLPRCRTLLRGKNSPDSTVKHFTMLGMSHEEMGYVISQWPSILNISSNSFQLKVEFFESVGIDRCSLGKIMHGVFRSLALSPSTLRGRCDFWKDYFKDVHENALHKLILKNSRVLAWNLQKTVKPKISYLEELGVSKKMLLKHSQILGYTQKAIAMKLKMLEQFGMTNATTTIKALLVLHGMSTLTLHARLHCLLALGFSFDQVQKTMVNFPQLLTHSEDHIKLRLSYAVNVMNISFDALGAFPMFWGISMRRLEYRYEVMQELKALGAYEKDISLGYMLNMTDAIFSRRFVRRLQAYTKHANI